MKRFLLKSLLYSLPILVPITIFISFVNPYLSGDIGPLGYIKFPNGYARSQPVNNKIINCNYNCSEYCDNDILTIGDSFSQGDNTYNFFIAEYWNNKVFNLYQDRWANHFNRFVYLSKTQKLPKVVIVESVERYLIERLNKTTFNLTADEMVASGIIDTTSVKYQSEKKSVLEKTQEWMKRGMHLKGYENPIYSAKLSKPLFSCPDQESNLYFYCEDIFNMNPQDSLVNIAVEKLDSLFKYAESLDIELYVLIAADKYDVYQDYIVDNEYEKQCLLDNLLEKYNHPHLINSRDTLYKMVDNGVLDVYWLNNTHWSPIGSNAVAKQTLKIIEN